MAHKKKMPLKPIGDLGLVRAGGRVINMHHVVTYDLPVEGDPKQPLTLHFVNGVNLQLAGDDEAAVMAALGDVAAAEAE